jgi:putative membrane protein
LKSATSQLSSLYRFLWGIPLRGRLLVPAIAAYAIISLAISFLGGAGAYTPIIPASFTASILVGWILERLRTDLGMINSRRLNQLAIVSSCFIALGLAASVTPLGLTALAAIISVGLFIRGAIFLALSGKRLPRALSIFASTIFMEAAPMLLLQNTAYGLSIMRGYLIGTASSLLLILIFKCVLMIRGAPALDYVSSVLAYLLDNRKDWLREISEKLDDEAFANLDLLLLRNMDKRVEAAILIPFFHPGPFKDYGSSGLMYKIHEELRRDGVKAIFLKGFSNHYDNLISEEDCELILEKIRKIIRDNHEGLTYSSNACPPQILREGHVRGMLLGVGDARILLITTHPMGMEDIPNIICNCSRDQFLIPVDCHNSFSDSVKDLDEDSLQMVSKLLKRAEEMELSERKSLLFGYAQVGLNGYSREDGAGDLGVSAAVFLFDGRPSAIISLDGNNCLPPVRDAIVERLKSIRFEHVEVVTTDTHIVNGLRFGGRGYHPLGEAVPADAIAEKTVEAAVRALQAAKPMEAAWLRLKFPQVKIMSQSFLQEAAARTRQGIAIFILFLIGSMIAGAVF